MTATAVSARLDAAPRRAAGTSRRPVGTTRWATVRQLLTAPRPAAEPQQFAGPNGPVWG